MYPEAIDTATRLLSSRTLLQCSYKCLGKLWAVITRKFMGWIVPSKFPVYRKQQCRTWPMFRQYRANASRKIERNLQWNICVMKLYSAIWISLKSNSKICFGWKPNLFYLFLYFEMTEKSSVSMAVRVRVWKISSKYYTICFFKL